MLSFHCLLFHLTVVIVYPAFIRGDTMFRNSQIFLNRTQMERSGFWSAFKLFFSFRRFSFISKSTMYVYEYYVICLVVSIVQSIFLKVDTKLGLFSSYKKQSNSWWWHKKAQRAHSPYCHKSLIIVRFRFVNFLTCEWHPFIKYSFNMV